MKTKIAVFLIVVILYSCTTHRPLTATSFEPLQERKKGDFSVNAGIRPFAFYQLNVNYAPTDFLTVRLGNGGWVNLTTYDASIIFFKDFKNIGFYVAPLFSYQRNTQSRLLYGGGSMFGYLSYKYNTEFYSPGYALGTRLFFSETTQLHACIKYQYNFNTIYEYAFYKYDGSASSYGGHVYNNEQLNYKLPNFWSYEWNFTLTEKLNEFMSFKFTLGMIGSQRPVLHRYLYYSNSASTNYSYQTIGNAYHPVIFAVNIGAGLIFEFSRKKKNEN